MEHHWFQRYRRASKDAVIAGVCGGFGQVTPIPSWAWRVIFLLSLGFFGFGALLYLFIWLCAPPPDPAGVETPGESRLNRFKLSTTDYWFAGVCGGLGEVTHVPSWVWRVIFLCLALYGGLGVLIYLILWVCSPRAASHP